MKAGKKIQKQIDARMRDFQETMNKMERAGYDTKGYKAPGSRKKVY